MQPGTRPYLVCEVPQSNTDTLLHGQAGADDSLVVGRLLGEQGLRLGKRHADVELVDGDLDAQGSEGLPVRNESLLGSHLTDDQVSLNTDTIDGYALGYE